MTYMDYATTASNETQIRYAYDANGIRNSKKVNNTVHSYVTQSGKVVRETIGSGSSATVLDFIYDNHGLPFALNYSTQAPAPRQKSTLCATVGTTTTPKRDSIMYPAVITILRLVGLFPPDTTDVLTATPMGLTDKNLYPRGVRSGIRQLQKYNKNLGGGFNLRLELY